MDPEKPKLQEEVTLDNLNVGNNSEIAKWMKSVIIRTPAGYEDMRNEAGKPLTPAEQVDKYIEQTLAIIEFNRDVRKADEDKIRDILEKAVELQSKIPLPPIRNIEELEKWLANINRPFEGLNKLDNNGMPISKEQQLLETRKQVRDFILTSLDRKDNPDKYRGSSSSPNRHRPQSDQTIASQAAEMVKGYFRSPK